MDMYKTILVETSLLRCWQHVELHSTVFVDITSLIFTCETKKHSEILQTH